MPKAYITDRERQMAADAERDRHISGVVNHYMTFYGLKNADVADMIGLKHKTWLAARDNWGIWKLTRLRQLFRCLKVPQEEIGKYWL